MLLRSIKKPKYRKKEILVRKISVIAAMLLAGVLICTGCREKEEESIWLIDPAQMESTEKSTEETTRAPSEAETAEEATAEETQSRPADIPCEKPVKLYYMDYGNSTARLITVFKTPWNDEEDIGIFGAFNSDDEEIEFDSEKEAHLDLWDIDTEDEYKIGYEISFEINGEKRVYTLLEPADIEAAEDLFHGDVYSEEVTGYLGVWMYDDVNQEDGARYSHVTPDEYSDETLLTSIKLRLTPQSDEVSELRLKCFAYSSNLEFNEDGHYANKYQYEIGIVSE
jgi:hypothetical protein